MQPKAALRNGYDAFISHNHTDKPWARQLAERLSLVNFNGRPLRPWLDEKFLDPGELGQKAELTTALDRSRTLLLVLSPAAVASRWVEFEFEYFLRDRTPEGVILLLKTPCAVPASLTGARLIDFTDPARFEQAFAELVARLCPPGNFSQADVQAAIKAAWEAALADDPGGFSAGPTPLRDALLAALLRFPIDEPETEGLALTGFSHAAELLLQNNTVSHPAAYNMQMLLGECLAVAISRQARYRQVAQHYLDHPTTQGQDPVLAFVVVRAYSKLAEIDPALIDLSALLRVAALLDVDSSLNNKKESIAALLGRVAAKLRGSDLGDLMIQTLSEGGPAARFSAIGGISMAEQQASPVFYVSDLAALHADHERPVSGATQPPSRKLQALLFGIDLRQPWIVRNSLKNAKDELQSAFGIDDLPYSCLWFDLHRQPPTELQRRAPFIGKVVKATAANMEELASGLDASHVVCLTEPRIVEALFDRAGSLLIPLQEGDSPQCRRLEGRGVPFAMLSTERMAGLQDGDCVEIDRDGMRVVSHR